MHPHRNKFRSVFRRRIGNGPTAIPRLLDELRERLQADAVLDEGMIFRLVGAADEALQNALVHGNLEVHSGLRDRTDGAFDRLLEQRRHQSPFCDRQIEFSLEVSGSAVRVTVTDQGPGFDPSDVPDPRQPEFCERGHGRGLLMMRAFADEVRYNARGNEVTLIVKRPTLCGTAAC